MRVHQARKQYLRWLLATRDLSPHTIRAYDSDIAALEGHMGVSALVNRIDRDCLVAFVGDLRSSGLSATSIRRRAAGLRGFCRWLLSSRLLEADPWTGVTLSAGRQRKLPRVVPSHELDRLFGFLQMAADVDAVSNPTDGVTRPHDCTTLLA